MKQYEVWISMPSVRVVVEADNPFAARGLALAEAPNRVQVKDWPSEEDITEVNDMGEA